MLLSSILARPLNSLQYLERYVNDGSPSGFTEINRPSPQTDPFGFTPHFELQVARGPADWFQSLGQQPDWIARMIRTDTTGWLLIHPDMREAEELARHEISFEMLENAPVVPTSSGRTVQFCPPNPPDYVKLHYSSVLGRIQRHMPFQKLVAGLETSAIVAAAVADRVFREDFAVFPETGGILLTVPTSEGQHEWGLAWRPFKPLTAGDLPTQVLVPFFSLFSVDRLASYQPPILAQLIDTIAARPMDFIIDTLVVPLVTHYVTMVSQLGLQPEWNAQNLLVSLNDALQIVALVMRDMTDVERDLTIREQNRLTTDFASYPYKCISARDGRLYKLRHSFAFDFKLGTYTIDPLATVVAAEYKMDRSVVRGALREAITPILRRLPPSYFPEDGHAYCHGRHMLTGDRPYVSMGVPLYRGAP